LAGVTEVSIRPGRASDVQAITDIINHYVTHTAITFDREPYTPQARAAWMAQFTTTGRYRLFVAEQAGRVVGYADTHRFRDKAAYEATVETSVYLAPDAHGRGIGTRLYEALFAALAGEDVHRALAGITLPNAPSIALHRRFGFESCGVMHEVGRKHERYWDVEWYERASS
jgi:phosphinothricin acetyltransferase